MITATFANSDNSDVLLDLGDGFLWAVKPDDPRLADVPIAPFVAPSAPIEPAPTEVTKDQLLAALSQLLGEDRAKELLT